MLPTFFVIGATRAGTTSLSTYLASHPAVHMSPIKEPHYFVEPGDGLPRVDGRVAGRAEYEALFDSPLPARGEASTSYSHFPARRGVPERISESVPDARVIYLVRDPIDRLFSHYLHQRSFGGETRPLEAALGDLADPMNIYVCAGLYATQLRRYLAVFSPSQVLVIDQVELRQERVDTLRDAFGFLGLEPVVDDPAHRPEFNRSDQRRVYPRRYASFRDRAPLRRLPEPIRSRVRAVAQAAERVAWRPLEKPELSPSLRAQLEDVYRAEIMELRALTGKAFSSWSL